MTTKVEIWNMALGNVRAQAVQGLQEQSRSADLCRDFYPSCYEAFLTESPWKFATSWSEALAELSDPPRGWKHIYQLPVNTLRVWRVRPADGMGVAPESLRRQGESHFDVIGTPFGTTLVANHSPLQARITTKIDEGRLPAPAVLALSHLLAMYLSVPLMGVDLGGKARDSQYKMYLNALAPLNIGDSEQQEVMQPQNRYVTARGARWREYS